MDQAISSPLKLLEFRYFLAARFFFIMALRLVNVAVTWHVTILTKSTLAVGLLALSEVIPALSFALYAGHVVDASDKRKLLMRACGFYTLTMGLLLCITLPQVEARLGVSVTQWCIYACIFLTGVIRAFSGPAFHSILPQIVGKNVLAKAITMSSASWQTAAVAGPLLAGFLIALIGITTTLGIVIVIVLAALLALTGVQRKPVQLQTDRKTWDSVREGLRFVFHNKTILGALSLDLFAVFFGGAIAMLSFYVTDILKVGPIWFGWLNAAASLGSIGVLIFISIKPITKNHGRVLLYCVAAFGICIIVFGLSKNVWLSLCALTLSGVFDGISVVIRATIMQLFVPDEMRGRVSSVNSMFINSSNELGQFESAVAANLMGIVPSVVFGGCMTLLVVAATWFKAPTLRKLQY
jgi:MFS family permease